MLDILNIPPIVGKLYSLPFFLPKINGFFLDQIFTNYSEFTTNNSPDKPISNIFKKLNGLINFSIKL